MSSHKRVLYLVFHTLVLEPTQLATFAESRSILKTW